MRKYNMSGKQTTCLIRYLACMELEEDRDRIQRVCVWTMQDLTHFVTLSTQITLWWFCYFLPYTNREPFHHYIFGTPHQSPQTNIAIGTSLPMKARLITKTNKPKIEQRKRAWDEQYGIQTAPGVSADKLFVLVRCMCIVVIT